MEEPNEPVLLQIQQPRQVTNGTKIFLISTLLLITVASVTFSIFSFMKSRSIEEKFTELSNKFELANSEFKTQNQAFQSQDITNKQFINALVFNALQHDMEDGVVTDNFVINKITFRKTLSAMGTSGSDIDLSTQPLIDAKYEGQGHFDLTDRELKVMIEDLLKDTETYFESIREIYIDYLPEWKSLSHTVSIQNYELGTYSDGVFKLKGE
ncbi:hypothetical protein [Paenibacillus sp. sgz500992]|uniref:hypothetical protein n=1 Tax=Paenibacillus sp. sgz500992 TaxID=3242476 RepID=UPI0036D3476F